MIRKLLITNVILALGLLFQSCKQTIIVNQQVQIEKTSSDGTLSDFIQANVFSWSFALLLFALVLGALFLWKAGYGILKWFKGKPLSGKIVIVSFCFAVLFGIGCLPQNSFGGWFAIPVFAALFTSVFFVKSLIDRHNYKIKFYSDKSPLPDIVRTRRNLQLLGNVMLCVWSYGWLLYFIAIGIVNKPHVGAEVLWRSAMSSFNLFLTSVDSTIMGEIHEYDILKGMISCIGFTAVICTVLLIVNLVLYRMSAYLNLKHLLIDHNHNHLYIFFGINDASKLLAKSVYDDDSRSVIVFVESDVDGKTDQNEDRVEGWKHIVNLFTHRRKAYLDVDENERRALAISSCGICSLDVSQEEVARDVFGNIGIDSVKRHIHKLKSFNDAELHIFFLSEERETNVRATTIIANDDLVGAKEFQTTIYCHARRNTINRVIEDFGQTGECKINVRIIDSSHLAVEQLKRNVRNHPVNYVSVQKLNDDNPGTVSSEFNSLVMGFGETGQEAVNFLYEYGAFVDKNASELVSFRSPFKCYVLDKNMSELEGHYVSGIPGVSCKKCHEDKEYALVKFYPYDYKSDEFFTKVLSTIAEKLNYVVVAIGDDEENMTVAVEILRYVRIRRKNLENFCIYVRAYEKGSFQYLSDIANSYNRRLKKDDNEDLEKIVLFGQNEKIYTYNLVVKDKFQVDGRNYYEAYRSLQIDPRNDEGSWDERHEKTLNDRRITYWERLSKIKRKESQDRSNALHAQTKMLLLKNTIGEENAKDFALRALKQRTGSQTGITYPHLSPKENQLMLNLAMCEHLRWNAAHEIMGYVNNENEHKCNELTKRHNCLKPWQNLDYESDNADYPVDFKLFDFGVVETSLKLDCVDNN